MFPSRQFRRLPVLAGAVAGLFAIGNVTLATEVSIILPLHRVAYQTNEWIDVSVARSDAAALPAGNLTLTVTGDDASKMVFVSAKPSRLRTTPARPSICI